MSATSIRLNEVFGPTTQGEGLDVGKACLFIRTQGCPVQCAGCDTAYSWDGSEKGTVWDLSNLNLWVREKLAEYPGCGIVVSGGEPLVHYRNIAWVGLLRELRLAAAWLSLETSGYIGKKKIEGDEDRNLLESYLLTFNRVHCSPKITPCLHGPLWQFEDMDVNLPTILDRYNKLYAADLPKRLAFKYVVRDERDLEAVNRHVQLHGIQTRGHEVFLMPYGIEADEVAEGCKRLIPMCAKHGYHLSPRLHALLYGKQRGV